MNKLEIEKEKTRQLTLLRDIKKIELKLLLEKNYKKKHSKQSKSLKLFEELQDTDESDLEITLDTVSMSDNKSSNSSNNSLDEVELK